MTFLPAYMGENVTWAGMSVNKVTLGGTVTTLALLSGAVGQYIAGRLVDRISAERLYLLSIAVGTICVFIMSVSTNVMLIAAAVVYAFFYFSTQPIQNYLLSRYFPPPPARHGLRHTFLHHLWNRLYRSGRVRIPCGSIRAKVRFLLHGYVLHPLLRRLLDTPCAHKRKVVRHTVLESEPFLP